MYELEQLLLLLRGEMARAKKLHGALHSHHEAYGVLAEEVSEYFELVRDKEQHHDRPAMRSELLQIAAVALRAAHELT